MQAHTRGASIFVTLMPDEQMIQLVDRSHRLNGGLGQSNTVVICRPWPGEGSERALLGGQTKR